MRWRRPARRLGGTGDGFGVILQHAFAPGVHQPEEVLRVGVALLSRLRSDHHEGGRTVPVLSPWDPCGTRTPDGGTVWDFRLVRKHVARFRLEAELL